MSRGPGHIQRAVENAFTENPLKKFYIEDLCCIAYPNHRKVADNTRIDQRRAVNRAATKVAKQMGWEQREDTSGNPKLFVGRRTYFESEQGKKARLENLRAAKGLAPLPPPEPTARELAAAARKAEASRLQAEIPQTKAAQLQILLETKERLELELEQVNESIEILRLEAVLDR